MIPVAVALLSGGIDSTVALAMTQRDWPQTASRENLEVVIVDYGQRHNREIGAAHDVLKELPWQPMRVTTLYMDRFAKLARASGLTARPRELEIDGEALPEGAIPSSYVPLRNTMMLTLAAACLESKVLDLIEHQEVHAAEIDPFLVIGANLDDYMGYPDCRPAFYETLSQTFFMGSKIGVRDGLRMRISTPLIQMSKAEIVQEGYRIGAPIYLTRSCYLNDVLACGKCDACRLRAKAFAEAGMPDPALGNPVTDV